jgi:hypothetical protein
MRKLTRQQLSFYVSRHVVCLFFPALRVYSPLDLLTVKLIIFDNFWYMERKLKLYGLFRLNVIFSVRAVSLYIHITNHLQVIYLVHNRCDRAWGRINDIFVGSIMSMVALIEQALLARRTWNRRVLT